MAGPIDSRLVRRARATRVFLVAGVGVGIATAILLIVQAWLLARAVVSVFHTHKLTTALPLLVPLGLVFFARALLSWTQAVLAVHSAAKVKSQLREEIMQARLQRPLTAGTSTSSLINLLTKGLDALDGYFAKYLPQLGLAATVPFIVGVVILWRDWPSALIVAFTLPLIPIFMALIGWTTQEATARRFQVQQRLANHFADLVEGLPTLQVFGRARAQLAGVKLTEEANRRETMRTLVISFLSAFALELLATLSVAVVAVTVGFRVVFGNIDFETALFVLVLAPEAFLPVRQVGVHFHDSADGVAAANAAFAIIDPPDAQSDSSATSIAVPRKYLAFDSTSNHYRIQFNSVSYRYPETKHLVVSDFNLTINPGEIVALAGTSGGGKSTLLALLMGFIQPTQGSITINGQNLASLDVERWRQKIAWVGQNPGMLTGTVGDNVRLGAPCATTADLRQALAEAGADFALDKSVGDDGEGLSAGERRRVALARALLRIRLGGAVLLVLDEPTAGLDAAHEAQALIGVKQTNAGALLVSHRPAVLELADRVVEVSNQHV